MRFALPSLPVVTVVIPVFNRAELTFNCLRSLVQFDYLGLEIIVIDNASTDDTERLFSRVEGIRYVRNRENLHFLQACNQGAGMAKGEFILFLNSDAEVLPGSLEAALSALKSDRKVGAVGAKLVLPDGTLQEAGSFVWGDGTCQGYGRGRDPNSPEYQFRRIVDYCSGAFLLTRSHLFRANGLFDIAFSPAYYEEVDYCLKLQEQGFQVLYEPRCVVQHFEFASSRRLETAIQLQLERQKLIVEKHHALLSKRPLKSEEGVLRLRSRNNQRRVLWVDERIPHSRYGSGYPRASAIQRALAEMGFSVTVYPAVFAEMDERWDEVYSELPREVEVMGRPPFGPYDLLRFLRERRGFFDLVFVSRPTSMAEVRRILRREPAALQMSKVIYDAEAIFAVRDQLEAEVLGRRFSVKEFERELSAELSWAAGVAHVTTVSEGEAQHFRKIRPSGVTVLSHAVPVRRSSPPFAARSGILFAGAILGDGGPNFDAVLWFCKSVLPILRARGVSDEFVIAGHVDAPKLEAIETAGVRITGRAESLLPFYDAAKVFVAPTRFSAGIPLKVIEAVSSGVPAVVTPLLAKQLCWEDPAALAVGDGPEAFASAVQKLVSDPMLWERQRGAAFCMVEEHHSPETLKNSLHGVIGSVLEPQCERTSGGQR